MSQGLRWVGFLATVMLVLLLGVNIMREPARQTDAQAAYREMAISGALDLYALHCGRCHGAAGEGLGVYRALDQDFVRRQDPALLHNVIARGRYATDMAAFARSDGGVLTHAQVDTLVTLIQYGDWERVAQRVAELDMLPTEADILAATQTVQTGGTLAAVPLDAAILAVALETFAAQCVECHGENGAGTFDAPALNNPYVRGLPLEQLTNIVTIGVRNTDMEGFAERLPADEIAALLALLKNWDVVDENGTLLAAADMAAPAANPLHNIASPEEIAAVPQSGQELFGMWCAICHGVNGEGGSIAPSLNDIPVLPADFIFSRVRSGKNAMPPFDEGSLPNGQAAVVIEYAQDAILGSALPELTADELALAGSLYDLHCGECHGPQGVGVVSDDPLISGPPLVKLPPLRGSVITNFTRVGSVVTPGIPVGVVSDDDLALIVAYLHSLSR